MGLTIQCLAGGLCPCLHVGLGSEVLGKSVCPATHVDGLPLAKLVVCKDPTRVSCDILAANDLGTGSGWQQSKQNWVLLAVVGT